MHNNRNNEIYKTIVQDLPMLIREMHNILKRLMTNANFCRATIRICQKS